MLLKISKAKPFWFAALSFPYHDELKNWVKGIPGSKWHPGSKQWLVPIEMVARVIQKAEAFTFTVEDNR